MVITAGAIPALIIYALFVGPIQNRIANRRRSNTSFSPSTRAELSYSDIAEVKIKGRDVTLKGKKVKLSFRATKQEADSIASFLQQRLDSKLLSVRWRRGALSLGQKNSSACLLQPEDQVRCTFGAAVACAEGTEKNLVTPEVN